MDLCVSGEAFGSERGTDSAAFPRVRFKSRLERSFIRTYECYLFVDFVTFGSIKASRKEDEEE